MVTRKNIMAKLFVMFFALSLGVILISCDSKKVNIMSIDTNENRELEVLYSNNELENIGSLNTQDNLYITSIKINDKGNVEVFFSNNTSKNVGSVLGLSKENRYFSVSETHIRWMNQNTQEWHNLISLNLMTSSIEEDQSDFEIRINHTHVQFRTNQKDIWQNLISNSVATGNKNQKFEFDLNNEYIQWQYVNHDTLYDLVNVKHIKEFYKDTDKTIFETYLKYFPSYQGNQKQWINALINDELDRRMTNFLTVDFDTDGGSYVESQYIEPQNKLNKIVNPKKAGYLFDGWYFDEEKWIVSIYPVTENLTLKAKWIPNYLNIEFEDLKVTYNGETHSLTIKNLPESIRVIFENNDQVNAGIYEVVAHLEDMSGTYIVPSTITATLEIEKATISNIVFKDLDVKFDGTLHELIIQSELPTDVNVQYTTNKRTHAGKTEVIAVFLYDKNNYNTIDNLKATLSVFYEVTYVNDNESEVVKYYDDIVEINEIAHDTLTFKGWSTNKDDETSIIKYPYKLTGNISLYAIFK